MHDDWVYWVSHHLAASQSALELHWPGHTRTVQPATALYLVKVVFPFPGSSRGWSGFSSETLEVVSRCLRADISRAHQDQRPS
jgi:hypothetical protein